MLNLLPATALAILLIGGLWLFVRAFFRSNHPRDDDINRRNRDTEIATGFASDTQGPVRDLNPHDMP